MEKPRSLNPWLVALLSWALATGLVAGVYAVWQVSQGKVAHWSIVRDAALMAAPIALFRAWRDRARKE